MLVVELLFKIVKGLWNGCRRVLDVKRSADRDPTATEYADALLFGGEDSDSSDWPPSIKPL